jgi:hypothetical protein
VKDSFLSTCWGTSDGRSGFWLSRQIDADQAEWRTRLNTADYLCADSGGSRPRVRHDFDSIPI